MHCSREAQEYWSGEPIPSPADLPNPGIEPRSPTMKEDSSPTVFCCRASLFKDKGLVFCTSYLTVLMISPWAFVITGRDWPPSSSSLMLLFLNMFLNSSVGGIKQAVGMGEWGLDILHPCSCTIWFENCKSLEGMFSVKLDHYFLQPFPPLLPCSSISAQYWKFLRKYGVLHHDTWSPPTG